MPSSSGFIGVLGRVRLNLELTPQPTEIGGDVLAVAILTTDPPRDREAVPLAGQTIVFYLGENEAAVRETNPDGRAPHTFTGLGFEMNAFSVQTSGVYVTQRHAFPRPSEPSKAPTNFTVEPLGDDGTYQLVVTVFSQKTPDAPRIGIGNIKVIVANDRKLIVDGKTGPSGSVVIKVPHFRDRERSIAVSVEGVGRVERLQLLGP